MDSTITYWAFGFGGWLGVFGSLYFFVNIPQAQNVVTLLVSPWLGGIGLYLILYMTHSWINVSRQITDAMIRHDVIMAVLTSCIGIVIVAIMREIIEKERPPQTLAEIAAAEQTETMLHTEVETGTESGNTSDEDEGNMADDESGVSPDMASEYTSAGEEESETDNEHEDASEDGEESEGGEESENDESEGGEESENDESEGGEESDGNNESDDDESDGNNEQSTSELDKARLSEESSFENIHTPQLSAIPHNIASPIPTITDI